MNTVDTTNDREASSLLLSPTLKKNQTIQRKVTTARKGWSTIDSKETSLAQLQLPQALKTLDIAKAQKEALVAFGTTPDKMQKVQEARKRGVKDSAESTTTANAQSKVANPLTTKVTTPIPFDISNSGRAKPKSSGAGPSYPPMSKSAPKPFQSSQIAPKPKTEDKTQVTSSIPKKKESFALTSSPFPPMSTKAPTPFNMVSKSGTENTTSTASKVTTSSSSKEKSNETGKETKPSGLFGDMKGFGDTLTKPDSMFGTKKSEPAVQDSSQNQQTTPDYRKLLNDFYQKHNPAKIIEVEKTLQKYKVCLQVKESFSYFLMSSASHKQTNKTLYKIGQRKGNV